MPAARIVSRAHRTAHGRSASREARETGSRPLRPLFTHFEVSPRTNGVGMCDHRFVRLSGHDGRRVLGSSLGHHRFGIARYG